MRSNLDWIMKMETVYRPLGFGERALQSRNGRREEVLSSLGHHPFDRERERSSLSLRVHTRDSARGTAIRRLANDGVESRLLWLVDRESNVVRPSCVGRYIELTALVEANNPTHNVGQTGSR